MSETPAFQQFDNVIRARRTTKALSPAPLPTGSLDRAAIEEIVAAAGWAPFHRPAAKTHSEGALTSSQPWRCYLLDAEACRSLRQRLVDAGDATKVPQMLAVANCLIQLTWLPNPSVSSAANQLFEPTIENMEHIAAASAAAQNILLAATARGIPSYWSSGGALRSANVFRFLDIPETEILLGAIFLFPSDLSGIETTLGAHRDKRGDREDWSRWVEL